MESEYEEIHKLCRKYNISDYEINHGVIDVMQSITFSDNTMTAIPFRFGTVTGDFRCIDCPQLEDMDGCPAYVHGSFDFTRCGITSMYGAPVDVMGYFSVEECALTSLQYFPEAIGGDIYLHGNPFIEDDSFFEMVASFSSISEYGAYQDLERVRLSLETPLGDRFGGWLQARDRKALLDNIINS